MGAQLIKIPAIVNNLKVRGTLTDRNGHSLHGRGVAVRAVTGTADTFVAADKARMVTRTNGSASTQTIPPFSSVEFETGDELNVVNLGVGDVTLTAGSGVTFANGGAGLVLNTGAWATLRKIATNVWAIQGPVAAS